MKKIKTPFGELRDSIQLRIEELKRERQVHMDSFNENGADICDYVIDELSAIKQIVVENTPTERDMIKKSFIEGAKQMEKCHKKEDQDFYDPEDYFTQTFDV